MDQFEEVFTLCADEAVRRDLIANLLHAATVAGGRTVVVLTMRADFNPRCAGYADLAAALSDQQMLVGPMTDDELRRAIDHPARLAGLEPQPGLVDNLVREVRSRPGALPLLQFALQDLWGRREAHRLTIGAYCEIGGIEGALQRKADAVYAGLTPEQQELCRRIFLRLVQPGEGSEDTRRRASLREVIPADPTQAEAVRAIIARLTDPESRLITSEREQPSAGDGTLEVAHKAMIRGWPKLRKWIEDDRAGLRAQRHLTDAAREWADATPEAKESVLFAGARLAVAAEWAATHRDELSALEAAFLSASQEHESRIQANEAERNRRLAEAERLRAEEAEHRKHEAELAAGRLRRFGRGLLVATSVSLFLALAAGLQTRRANRASGMATTEAHRARESETKEKVAREYAVQSKLRAEENEKLAIENELRAKDQADLATSRQLAALFASERNKRLDRSLLLAVEALRAGTTVEARESLFLALQARQGLQAFLHLFEGGAGDVAFSPDGATLAAACGPDGVVLWDVASRRRLPGVPLSMSEGGIVEEVGRPDPIDQPGVPLPAIEGGITGVAFSPDGAILAAGYAPGGVVLWDVAARRRILGDPLSVPELGVSGVAFSPDGRTLAAGYSQLTGGRDCLVPWDLDLDSWQRLAE